MQLIRKGAVPLCGTEAVRLMGADPTLPKGGGFILGTGWTQKSNDSFVFDVPPGANFQPLQFDGLNIGAQYRLTFVVAADTGYGNTVFRPGELGLDTVLDADGAYDITFTAQNINGISRILCIDVTGITRLTFNNLKLAAL